MDTYYMIRFRVTATNLNSKHVILLLLACKYVEVLNVAVRQSSY